MPLCNHEPPPSGISRLAFPMLFPRKRSHRNRDRRLPERGRLVRSHFRHTPRLLEHQFQQKHGGSPALVRAVAQHHFPRKKENPWMLSTSNSS